MTYGRSLQRHLYHFGLPTVFIEWANLAQDRAGWHKLITTPPFAIGKPFVRQPRGDTRVTPEELNLDASSIEESPRCAREDAGLILKSSCQPRNARRTRS